jgi:hypothetical protein
MPIRTVYVQAKSKADINRRLEAGETVLATEYNRWEVKKMPLGEMIPDGTVIKVFSQFDPFGTPYAKAYGNWNSKRGRVI